MHREIGTIATVREQLDANRESWLAEQADRRQRCEEWQAEIRRRKVLYSSYIEANK